MTRLTEAEKWPGHEVHIFPCDCNDGDYLKITWDEDLLYRYLLIEGHWAPAGWRRRIEAAWSILRRGSWHAHEIILNDKAVASFKAFIDAKVGK